VLLLDIVCTGSRIENKNNAITDARTTLDCERVWNKGKWDGPLTSLLYFVVREQARLWGRAQIEYDLQRISAVGE
jgi:hypothetical protein